MGTPRDTSHPPPSPSPNASGGRAFGQQPIGLGAPPAQPDTPTRPSGSIRYTSLSTLLKSPENSPKTRDRNVSSGWHLPSVDGGLPRSPLSPHSPGRDEQDYGATGSGAGANGNGKNGNGHGARRWSNVDDERPSFNRPLVHVAPSPPTTRKRLGLWRLIALTVAMGGSQIVWTVELGYGTPYLLELGLSEQLTSLVWLAGPISGLVVQPLIGAISDSSTSKYRRRFWIVASTALIVFAELGLAFTEPIAKAIVDLYGGGQGDWDPKTGEMVRSTAIIIAVFCFYCLDFALNGLQASLRNLVFDVTPSEQINSSNAWNGRFNHIGSIVGFAMASINLNGIPLVRWIGGEQFRKLCVLSLIIVVITVWITCWNFEEDERPTLLANRRSKLRDMINTIHDAVRSLPRPVRRICMVQIAAFMGWFPFLFYSTTYVAEVMGHEQGRPADRNDATRVGSFALLIYSFVAIIAGTVLPHLSERDQRLLRPKRDNDDDGEDEDHDAEVERIRSMVRQWRVEDRKIKLPRMPFMLRNIWTSSLVLFFVLMMSTFIISKVWQATIMISLVGICWAVACWVPFAMIMEFLKEIEARQNKQSDSSISQPGASLRSSSLGSAWRSTPTSPTVGRGETNSSYNNPDERTALTRPPPMLRSYSAADLEGATVENHMGQGPVAGGTIMGIHNLAIVLPQFIVAIAASIIFQLADGGKESKEAHPGFTPDAELKNGTAWVLRFGGLMALVGAAICRRVPPTKTEKAMRRRLAEMREEADEDLQ